MEKYEKYKDSGIEWIGEIPEHWEVKKLNYCFSVIGSGTTPTAGKTEYYNNGEYNWLQTGDLNNFEIIETSKKITQEALDDYSTLRFYPANSIAIAMYGATIGKTGLLKIKSTTNQACCVLSEPINLNSKFAFYWLNSIKNHIISLSYGGGQPNINQEQIRSLKIQNPPPEEQTAIANYLDRKTAEIDELIADKKRLLELYEEEKTAIINQAVTKGINPGVPMKDSGIEWLGVIPEHWEVKRIATFGSFSKGKGIPRSELKDDGFPAILYGDIYTKYDIKADVIKNHINEETTKTSVAIEKGDLLFTGSGETAEDIGKCIAYLGEETVYVGGDVIILRQKKHNSLFLSYSLSSNSSIFQKASMAKGQIIIHIYASNLREIYLPIPPKEEQTAIVQFIETEISRINLKAEKNKKLIDLLTEYRTALISEVVTGKIKVI